LHKPHRRKAVLSSLFIKNITDVISTGDIVPEISAYNVEITGVKISPCSKILNVFWQVPVSQFDSCADIARILAEAAPKIRAELISRNVLGRVPFVFFLRDGTNEKISAFETAISKLDAEPQSDSNVIVDDSFLKNMFLFKSEKVEKKSDVILDDKQELTESNEEDTRECTADPEKPVDMKCDIFGLDHDIMMEKVIALKKKVKGPRTKSALILPDSLKDDLFENIPGIRFEADSSSRDDILKQFQVQRRMLMKQKKINLCDNNQHYEDTQDDDDNVQYETYEEDFIDDEADNSHR